MVKVVARGRPTSGDAEDSSREVLDRSVLEEKLGFRLRLAERATHKDFMQTAGMTPVQYSVLTLVSLNQGMSQGVIGEALNMDRASIMAIMDKLEGAGLVERRRSEADRRRYEMHLTSKGKKKLAKTEQQVRQSDDKFKQRLSDKQLRDLIHCLDLLASD